MKGYEKVTNDFYIDWTKELGKGNFGSVYKGYQASETKFIAVKFMDKKMLAKCPEYEREINVMEDLSKISHPNIMGYYGYHKNETGLYFFIEHCSGGTLKQLISKKISEMKVLALYEQMLKAMTYINSENKVHRDLKPENILLNENMELKIADFGLARDLHVMMTKGACTPLYAAPEVINLENYNEKCDVWSAGMILYEMLAGKEMFSHVKTKPQLMQELAKFNSGNHKILLPRDTHKKWETLIREMLTYKHDNRPNFKQMLKIAEKVLSQIEKDLAAKYDDEGKDFQVTLDITKTINPYISNNGKGPKVDMEKRLKQEISYKTLNNLRKFLTFFRLKSDFMSKLLKEFTNNTYGGVKNVYKYMLMFLSMAAYIAKVTENISQVKGKKVKTPDGVVSEEDIDDAHVAEFEELLKEYAKKHENTVGKFKNVLEKQINSKLTGSYMKREEEKNIITKYENILPLIEDSSQGKFKDEDEYMRLYIKLTNMNEIYLSAKELEEMEDKDVKTYAYIRIISNLDKVFNDKNYQNDDYIRVRKQEIENMGREEQIAFIQEINKR